MVTMQTAATRLSKSEIGDLALRSAIELERAGSGAGFDVGPLQELAAALRQSAGPAGEAGRVAHMRPGYFEPFERLYRSRVADEPESLEQIRGFVTQSIDEIDEAASQRLDQPTVSKLVDFCLELSREFVRRQPVEDRGGRSQRSIPVEALVR